MHWKQDKEQTAELSDAYHYYSGSSTHFNVVFWKMKVDQLDARTRKLKQSANLALTRILIGIDWNVFKLIVCTLKENVYIYIIIKVSDPQCILSRRLI